METGLVSSKGLNQSGALLFKTRPPELSSGHLDRSDLILSALAKKSVLLCLAPAGYGKTLALAAAADVIKLNRTLLWYQCDRLDTSPSLFIQACYSSLGLEAPEKSGTSFEQLLHLLDVIKGSQRPLTIVMDNIESLSGELVSEDASDLIQVLVKYRPDNLQLVLSGHHLPFPAGNYLLDERFAWVSSDTLAFTLEECGHWLQAQQVVLRREVLPNLLSKMSGWPAGLALWLMAWRCAGMPDRWSGELGIQEMSEYLSGEVISALSSELRESLFRAAVLGTFNESLLSDVSGGREAHADMQEMLSRRLYIREVPGRPEWYRMEPLISQCLTRLLKHSERERVHTEAYQWFRDRNEPIAALYHAGQIEVNSESSQWLAEQSDTILASLNISGLLNWLDQLNDDQLEGSPALLQMACWTDLFTYRLEAAGVLIDKLAVMHAPQEAELAALQGYLAGLKGELSQSERYCKRALELLPPERSSVRFLVSSMLTSVAMAHRDPDAARLWNRYALDIARKARQPSLVAMAHLDHARIEFNRGHVSRCLTLLNQGLDILETHQLKSTSMAYGRLMVLSTAVSWVTGIDSQQVDVRLAQALALCEENSDPSASYGYAIRALNLMGEGAYGQALSLLDDGERFLQEHRVDFVAYAWLHTVRSNIWISQHKYRRAHDCLSALLENADAAGVAKCEYSSLLPGFTTLTMARLCLMSGRTQECLELTDDWLRDTPNGFMSVFIRLIRAGALVMNQQSSESVRQLDIVKRTFRTEGVNRQLHNWLPDLASFLAVPAMAKQTPSTLNVALSDREKDVVKLMAQGLSNQEIAEKLFISLHTVKTHARKVNVKLGTRSRTQAIHLAKELMII
jgi:LuxR family maltose regulon positive regulatory protein